MTTVKFIKQYTPAPFNKNHSVESYIVGDILECDNAIADSLVSAGVAEVMAKPKRTRKAKGE